MITIGAVGFNGWRESHEKGVQQQTNIDAISAVSTLVDEADAIQQTFLANDDARAIEAKYANWFAETSEALTQKLGPSYATSFRSAPNVYKCLSTTVL
ncbi:MAG: hypothetical protein WA851_17770 [Xanthobacteraceae bacterium]